jgi:phosphate transport system substrate-binding protein
VSKKFLLPGMLPVLLLAVIMMPGKSVPAPTPALVKVDGSSTVFPITEGVAEEFQASQSGRVRVTVGISGTGGGFKKFCRQETDVQDASRPILKEEIEACRVNGVQYVELPIAYDAITIVVNPQNTWVSSLTLADLKRIWEPAAQNTVKKWRQVQAAWPDAALKLFGAGADSGTFDYFTEAVVGKAKAGRGDYTASEDDNTLVQGVGSGKYALGFLPLAYFEPNQQRLKAVPIDAGKGPVLPSRQTVENGTYTPLARPIFIYVNARSAQRPEVKAFVEFYLENAAILAAQAKYVPLPPGAYATALQHFRDRKVGTVFHGASAIGLRIAELLQREARL